LPGALGAVQAAEAIRRKLGDGLRKTYDPTVREPLPSDWLKFISNRAARGPSQPQVACLGLTCATPHLLAEIEGNVWPLTEHPHVPDTSLRALRPRTAIWGIDEYDPVRLVYGRDLHLMR